MPTTRIHENCLKDMSCILHQCCYYIKSRKILSDTDIKTGKKVIKFTIFCLLSFHDRINLYRTCIKCTASSTYSRIGLNVQFEKILQQTARSINNGLKTLVLLIVKAFPWNQNIRLRTRMLLIIFTFISIVNIVKRQSVLSISYQLINELIN